MDKNTKEKQQELGEILFNQIMDVRDSGLTNMLDKNGVQRVAYDNDFHELVCFIEDHPDTYVRFILCGDKTLLSEP